MKVNATRMEMMKLKKRIKLAKKGHKLMKEKRDGLMKEFMTLIYKIGDLRKQVNQRLNEAFDSMLISRSKIDDNSLEMLFSSNPEQTIQIDITERNILNVKVPQFHIKKLVLPEADFSFTNIPSDVEITRTRFKAAIGDLIRLAELEKAVWKLSKEVETARRRTNALEYHLIPLFTKTFKNIKMKLEEMERSQFSKLIKIKADIEEREKQQSS